MTSGTRAEDPPEVLLVVEQLRRRVPGGIGTYARGLIAGLDALTGAEAVDFDLYASAPRRVPDPLAELGHRVVGPRLSSRLATRLWEHELGRTPGGYRLVHASATAFPPSAPSLVVTVHDLAWRDFPETVSVRARRFHERALERCRRSARRVVVPSRAVGDAVLSSGGFREHAIAVIEEGADHLAAPDEQATTALLDRLGVNGGFVLSVGTLEPRKNLARLVTAYGAARRRGLELPLVVVGPDGWGPRLEPAPGVLFAGAVADPVLAGLYRRATLFVYVPLGEGFGLPVVEAMASGTAVLSSPVPSAAGASQLVAPDDPNEIADALFELCSDDRARARLVASGRVRAAELTWSGAARRHLALWREVEAEA